MTGLSTNSAGSLQVHNYGTEENFIPHWDHRNGADDQFQINGKRMATMLFYVDTEI